MNKINLLVGLMAICLFFNSCEEEAVDKVKIVEMTIYPETGFGGALMSDIMTQLLVVSDSDDPHKRLLVDVITEGFNLDYQRGYEYKLKVKKIWMNNPPMDVSSIKYVFIELLSKTKVITKDKEQSIEMNVSWEPIKYTPNFPSEYNEDKSLKIYDALRVNVKGTHNWFAILEIEGFNPEPDYNYELLVNKVTRAEPYSISYVLQELISKAHKDD